MKGFYLVFFLIYGKSMVRVFWVKTWNFYEKIFKKTSQHDKVSYYLT